MGAWGGLTCLERVDGGGDSPAISGDIEEAPLGFCIAGQGYAPDIISLINPGFITRFIVAPDNSGVSWIVAADGHSGGFARAGNHRDLCLGGDVSFTDHLMDMEPADPEGVAWLDTSCSPFYVEQAVPGVGIACPVLRSIVPPSRANIPIGRVENRKR